MPKKRPKITNKVEHNICNICYERQGNKKLKEHKRSVQMEGDAAEE